MSQPPPESPKPAGTKTGKRASQKTAKRAAPKKPSLPNAARQEAYASESMGEMEEVLPPERASDTVFRMVGWGPFRLGGVELLPIWLTLALATLAILSIAAWRAAHSPNPSLNDGPPSVPWLTQALERNGMAQLTQLNRQLNAIAVAPNDSNKIWAVGQASTIVHSTDGGDSWQLQFPESRSDLNRLAQASNTKESAWQIQSTGIVNLSAVKFRDAMHGEALGETLQLYTGNGGETWQPEYSRQQQQQQQQQKREREEQQQEIEPADLPPLSSEDSERDLQGWRLEATARGEGLIYFNEQIKLAFGPDTVSSATPWRLPPPGYWLLLPLVFVLALRGIRKAPPAADPWKGSIADRAISDRPLDDARNDVLNIAGLANGLSAYLRNEYTTPPVTIAVTGPWGSGKSSVLNLLHQDLYASGFRPIRFNAWHQRKEEEIFTALLHAMRKHAIPPLFSLAGIRYRHRLVMLRTKSHPALATFLLMVGMFGVFYLTEQTPVEIIKASKGGLFKGLLEAFPALGAIIGAAGFMASASSQFGLNTVWGRLLGLLSLRQPEAAEQLGLRERFKQEFANITQALKPSALVIMIDDVDRCQPQQVMETLKTVNFLADCGDCYVVMGMAREMVERAIVDQYDALLSTVRLTDEMDSEQIGRIKREFARRYLEKMINIEVPVPQFTEESANKLLMALPMLPEKKRQPKVATIQQLLLATVLLAVAGFSGHMVGQMQQSGSPVSELSSSQGKPVTTSEAENTADRVATERNYNPALEGSSAAEPPASVKALPAVKLKQRLTSLRWPAITALIVIPLLLLLALWRIAEALREGIELVETTEDSKDFEEAILKWQSSILALHRSPRAVKRFVNKLRFLAMRQRVDKEGGLTEEQIIALAVLRDWLLKHNFSNSPSAESVLSQTTHEVPDEIRYAFELRDEPTAAAAVRRFNEIVVGVYMPSD